MYSSVLFLPFITAIVSGLLYIISIKQSNSTSRLTNFISWFIVTASMLLTFLFSLLILQKVLVHHQVFKLPFLTWLIVDHIFVYWQLNFNVVSALMVTIISLVSFLVYFYSLGYMSLDKSEQLAKFMCYLSFFSFFMLFLVLANDLLQMFIGWEGISLFSYYLISFLYQNETAPRAANKAFIINRVADCAFLIGLFLTFTTFDTFNIDSIFNQLQAFQGHLIDVIGIKYNVLTVIAMLFTIAAMGKSAQLFFHVWLPDAMEAPTPVSALLHAATMVTAGVFLLVRLSFLIDASIFTLHFIVVIGGLTCFVGASIAITANNLKKIIAYSTISQIGYMFIAIGCSFYNGAVFHIFTHAFFKGCLFLCAGIIIHQLKGEQNIFKMGGLARKMPMVYIITWVATLALCGIPPFSGFYSKEAILGQILNHSGSAYIVAYILGVITTYLTAFYCFKLIFVVFHGNSKLDNYHKHTSYSMVASILILLILILVSSYGYKFFVGANSSSVWENTIIAQQAIEDNNLIIAYFPLVLTVIGIFSAYLIYFKRVELSVIIANKFPKTYQLLVNKWYFDDLYSKIFVKGFANLSKGLIILDDKVVTPVLVNFGSRIVYRFSIFLNNLQTGKLFSYVGIMVLGLIVLLFVILWGYK